MKQVNEIIEALNSNNEEVRLQALHCISTIGHDEKIKVLLNAFGDESWRVRKQSIEMFLELPLDPKVILEVIQLLYAQDNAGLRNAAVETLVRFGAEAVPELVKHAKSSDHDVRKFIIDILGDIAAVESTAILIEGLNDCDCNVRAAAAENLGKLKSREAVKNLLRALQSPDLMLRFSVLEALGKISEPLSLNEFEPIKDDKNIRFALIRCLGKTGDNSTIPEILGAFDAPGKNVRIAAFEAVATIFDRYPNEVRKAVTAMKHTSLDDFMAGFMDDDIDDEIKRNAIKVLGCFPAKGVVEELLNLLESERLHQSALDALIDIGRCQPQKLLDIWDSLNTTHQASLAYVAGEVGCAKALRFLEKALQENDSNLVSMALSALGKVGSSENLPQILGRLFNASDDVKDAACLALTDFAKRHPVETLTVVDVLLHHEDAGTRRRGVHVLSGLDNPEIVGRLQIAMKDSSPEVRQSAAKAFEQLEVISHLDALKSALSDEIPEVRRAVARILATQADESVLECLELAMQDEDAVVRASAVSGFGSVDNAQSRSFLEKALSDPKGIVVIAALDVLASQINDETYSLIISVLGHADVEVVVVALSLLKKYENKDWISNYAPKLFNHPAWEIRAEIARTVVDVLGNESRPYLISRLTLEENEVVLKHLTALLDELPSN